MPCSIRRKGSDKSTSGIKLDSRQFLTVSLILTPYNWRPRAGGNTSFIIPFSFELTYIIESPILNFVIIIKTI